MVIDLSYLFSKKIGVGQFFGLGEDEATIELKETNAAAAAKFEPLAKDTEKATAYFIALLPSIIVDHDFWKDEAHKWEAREIADMVAGRAELCIYLMGRYVQEVLFTQGKESVSRSTT